MGVAVSASASLELSHMANSPMRHISQGNLSHGESPGTKQEGRRFRGGASWKEGPQWARGAGMKWPGRLGQGRANMVGCLGGEAGMKWLRQLS